MLKTKAILHCKDNEIRAHDCEITKVVELTQAQFLYFQQSLLEEYPFIGENADAMGVDENGVSRCLLVLGKGCEDGVLVRSEGSAYARYSALLPHARSILEAQTMSPALRDLNQKLTAFAEYAARECERQLGDCGRAELHLEKLAHDHGLDFYSNQTLWDTAADMIAERLDGRELDMEIDKEGLVFTDHELRQLIEICESKIPFDPAVAPSDQRWCLETLDDAGQLAERFEHGNWAIRTAFRYEDLYFVQRIGGGDEWLSLKRDGDTWYTFDSISFGHMIEQSDVDYCRGHLEYLAAAPAHELMGGPNPEREPDLAPTM